ncbi:hypothetical protein QN367_09570 [Cryobacterium sp. RTS3]|nr:hypothetical protein [Cryobacterium sp. RTS3]
MAIAGTVCSGIAQVDRRGCEPRRASLSTEDAIRARAQGPADVECRAEHVEAVQVQGHTDDVGGGENGETEHKESPTRADGGAVGGRNADEEGDQQDISERICKRDGCGERSRGREGRLEDRIEQHGQQGGRAQRPDGAVQDDRRRETADVAPREDDECREHERVETEEADIRPGRIRQGVASGRRQCEERIPSRQDRHGSGHQVQVLAPGSGPTDRNPAHGNGNPQGEESEYERTHVACGAEDCGDREGSHDQPEGPVRPSAGSARSLSRADAFRAGLDWHSSPSRQT